MKTLSDMVREAGLPEAWISKNGVLSWKQLKRFSKLVLADERARMAEQPAQQEPVAWIYSHGKAKVVSVNYVPGVRATPLYTSPQPAQRTWVGLTDEEKHEAVSDEIGRIRDYEDYADAIEAQLRERNT